MALVSHAGVGPVVVLRLLNRRDVRGHRERLSRRGVGFATALFCQMVPCSSVANPRVPVELDSAVPDA